MEKIMKLDWSAFLKPYKKNTVKEIVSDEGGVYLLWVKNKTRGWYCFYAGKAKDLEDRLLAHLQDSEPDDCIKEKLEFNCAFHFAEISTDKDRSGVEKYLIDEYEPVCNDVDPDVQPIRVNLPPDPND
jgi:hypothetical protein